MRLRLHWQLATYGWRRQTTYRAATLAGLFTNSVFGFVQAAVLVAARKAAGAPIAGYDTAALVTYAWLAQALIGPLAVFRWTEIADRVRSGEIATDFSRPADLQAWWLSVDVGRAGASVLLRSVPQVLIGAVFFRLMWPGSVLQCVAFALSLALAVVVSFGLRFLANVAVFWTVEQRGVMAAHNVLMIVLSGFIIPLGFYPAWLASLLRALPWAAAVQGPIDVFLGQRPAAAIVALQLVWIAALLALGRAVTRVAHRKLVVQGG